jgi:hypothetical protein
MKKRTEKNDSEKDKGHVIGREAFARISAVEGIELNIAAKDAFAEFERQQLSHEERRRAVIGRSSAQADTDHPAGKLTPFIAMQSL